MTVCQVKTGLSSNHINLGGRGNLCIKFWFSACTTGDGLGNVNFGLGGYCGGDFVSKHDKNELLQTE